MLLFEPRPLSAVPSWLRNKRGSYANPIIVEGLGKPASIIFRTYLSVENCRQAPLLLVAAELPGPALQPPSPLPGSYLYLLNFSILHPGNADGDHPFHAHNCTGLLLRNLVIKGVRTARAPILPAREAAKARAAGAGFNQYGHVIDSALHDVGFGWYVKGGSAHLIIAGNRIYRTETAGLMLGFDTGIEWMTPPWIRYEAYDIKVYNNIIHDVDGPGLAVYGGYNILVAHNTFYRVGQQAESLLVVRPGLRTCDGEWVDDTGINYCQQHRSLGGWGPPNDDRYWVLSLPNNGILIANNIFLNPTGTQAQHLYVRGPEPFCNIDQGEAGCQRCTDLPSTVASDTNLFIRGNVIWNFARQASGATPLGFEWGSGCQARSTCNATLVRATNAINDPAVKPQLFDPAAGDFSRQASTYHAHPFLMPTRLRKASVAKFKQLWAIPNWWRYSPGPASLKLPASNLTNTVRYDKLGRARIPTNNAPGAAIAE
ncbi:hypothetical protein COHA_000798 [Chlorella ohadii]|uniref:Right handed beta helix domain-containing protein n=1 Tax=Chlorella ohadii TaxID=2649997 RepID=A0AAD5E2N9_9CHLO|nr:hypothetical protein COHA_000798 [Chlorella ohadii]